MDKVVFNEVSDIISCMDVEYRKRIPEKFIQFINNNKEMFYNTNITSLPNNFDDLHRETVIILGIIYEKYFMNQDYINKDISDSTEELVNEINQEETSEKLVVQEKGILEKIKKWIDKINYALEKRRK